MSKPIDPKLIELGNKAIRVLLDLPGVADMLYHEADNLVRAYTMSVDTLELALRGAGVEPPVFQPLPGAHPCAVLSHLAAHTQRLRELWKEVTDGSEA